MYLHAVDYVWKQCCHIIVTHSHICHDFLKRNFFSGEILVLLIAIEFSAELGDFALQFNNIRRHTPEHAGREEHTRAKKRASPPLAIMKNDEVGGIWGLLVRGYYRVDVGEIQTVF